MEAASLVRVTKIKLSRDPKTGEKLATVELTRALDGSDKYTQAVGSAIEHMK
jgi:hypothetical protein